VVAQKWELSPEQVRKRSDPAQLGFTTTDELTQAQPMIGQERAQEALEFALDIGDERYNLYVSGQSGSGRLTAALKAVEQAASARPPASDLVYVYNFDRPGEPLAILLPAGAGPTFAHDVDSFVLGCRRELRRVFAGQAYQRRREALVKGIAARQAQVVQALQQEALAHGFLVQGTPSGLTTIPLKRTAPQGQAGAAGSEIPQPLSPEEFAALPEEEQQRLQAEHEQVEAAITHAVPRLRALEEEAREKIRRLDHETAQKAVAHLAAGLIERHGDVPRVTDYVHHLEGDIVAHADVLSMASPLEVRADGPSSASDGTDALAEDGRGGDDGVHAHDGTFSDDLRERPALTALLRRYRVNVLVTRPSDAHAPVVHELNPTFANLLGRIEFGLREGLPYTDHLMLHAGALHRANGGFLILQARDLFSQPHSWAVVKRVLRFGVIGIENDGEPQITPASAALRPEPLAASVKVILIGDPETYAALMALDPEFPELFSVRADFESDMPRTPRTERFYAEFAGDVARSGKYPPLTADAVALLVEQGSRWAADQERLSTRLRSVKDLTVEACYLARKAGASSATREHVARALELRERRLSLVPDRLDELIQQNTIMIATTGAVVGQVNGLTVMTIADYSFGKPARITARTSPGLAGIVNVERETLMSGPTHTKGILTLGGYLAGRYAQDFPLSLSASICFEQIYGEIEGDSASSAELYALLSSLSGLPIRQSLAVTGSVNQHGDIQAVGGVNEKIEGFFDVCQARGLTGEQGVIIPVANVRNLMLREDVVRAIQSQMFHVYAVSTIDEGIELLTGLPAGAADQHGRYLSGTVNALVSDRLRVFMERVRTYGAVPAVGTRTHA
jgi:predicted ATP-dependent protease